MRFVRDSLALPFKWVSHWWHSYYPNRQVTRAVNSLLAERPSLSKDEWFEQYWAKLGVRREVADFVYTRMKDYTALDFTGALPSDNLITDLRIHEVTYGDWPEDLRDDVLLDFGIDLRKTPLPDDIETVEQFVTELSRLVEAHSPKEPGRHS